MPFEPEDIDPRALKILGDAGFVWDPHSLAFRRSRKVDQASAEPARTPQVITYEFLRDQKLLAASSLDKAARTGQLLRLQIVIESLD